MPIGEVTYVDRHNGSDTSAVEQTPTVSLYESRLSDIETFAARIARVHSPVSRKRRKQMISFFRFVVMARYRDELTQIQFSAFNMMVLF